MKTSDLDDSHDLNCLNNKTLMMKLETTDIFVSIFSLDQIHKNVHRLNVFLSNCRSWSRD